MSKATIKEYLEETGQSQSDLARKIGVSRSYLSEIIGGTKQPSLTVASKIERATGVSAVSLVIG